MVSIDILHAVPIEFAQVVLRTAHRTNNPQIVDGAHGLAAEVRVHGEKLPSLFVDPFVGETGARELKQDVLQQGYADGGAGLEPVADHDQQVLYYLGQDLLGIGACCQVVVGFGDQHNVSVEQPADLLLLFVVLAKIGQELEEMGAIEDRDIAEHGIEYLDEFLPVCRIIETLEQVKDPPQDLHNLLLLVLIVQSPDLQGDCPHNVHTLDQD